MNLDDFQSFQSLDPEGMLAHIDGLPDQLQFAWELGKQNPRPAFDGLQAVLIAGMGGSAIGADLLAAYAAPLCSLPIFVHRDYDLPAWAEGPKVLVICSSHSGNTEETLSAFDRARANGCQILSVTTGGKLADLSLTDGFPVWTFEHHGQPRSAVGFSFGLILAALYRLGLLPDPENDLLQAVKTMRAQQALIKASSPVDKNPAKRLAGQLYDRMIAIFGSGYMAPVARRWKGQISEVAKTWGQFEFLPEVDHNTLAGLSNPAEILNRAMILFLRAPSDHPRNRLRSDLTRQTFMVEGFNTDFVDAGGDNPMAHIWSALHMGDYTAYYLAMMYGVDPTPIPAIENFKKEMKRAGES
jgi:glucose/mannose-6-phosphate isomerase